MTVFNFFSFFRFQTILDNIRDKCSWGFKRSMKVGFLNFQSKYWQVNWHLVKSITRKPISWKKFGFKIKHTKCYGAWSTLSRWKKFPRNEQKFFHSWNNKYWKALYLLLWKLETTTNQAKSFALISCRWNLQIEFTQNFESIVNENSKFAEPTNSTNFSLLKRKICLRAKLTNSNLLVWGTTYDKLRQIKY